MIQILSKDKDGQLKLKTEAFASKTAILNGTEHSLYKRIHGIKYESVTGSGAITNLEFVVPWNFAKIEAIEVIGANIGDSISLYVHDTPTGSITGTLEATGFTPIPNFLLDQFGYNVYMDDSGYYEQRSQYDADIIKDMKFIIKFKNEGDTKNIYINYILNELKA